MLKFSGWAPSAEVENDGVSYLADAGAAPEPDDGGPTVPNYPMVLACELESMTVNLQPGSGGLEPGSSITVSLIRNLGHSNPTVLGSVTYSGDSPGIPFGIQTVEFEPAPFVRGNTVDIQVTSHGVIPDSQELVSATVGIVAPPPPPPPPPPATTFIKPIAVANINADGSVVSSFNISSVVKGGGNGFYILNLATLTPGADLILNVTLRDEFDTVSASRGGTSTVRPHEILVISGGADAAFFITVFQVVTE